MGLSDMDEKERSRERSRRERPSRFSEGSRDRSPDRGRDRGSMKSSNNRVYVSNIPYEYRWQDMKDLFRSQVGDVQFVELFVDDNDKPKGCGIVEFSDSSCVKKCLEVMQRYEVKGRKLVVREDSGNVRDKHGNVIGGAGGSNKRSRDDSRYRDDRDRYESTSSSIPMRQDDQKWGNTYGLSPHFLESLNIDAPLCNRVFVANLEYNIEKKKLKEVFRLAGKVIRVEIPLDKDGRSRGFAVVEYDHPVEAVQAISMLHNQVLYDRPMTVRMDRANDTFKLPEGLKSIGMGLGTNGEPLRNVAHNLPSIGTSGLSLQQQTGAGLLGAVPNSALQVANALSAAGLNNVVGSSFGNLASNPSVLQQAANLGGLASNLLSNGLTNADLSSLASSQVSNLLAQNQTQLAALASSAAAAAAAGNVQQGLQNAGNNGGGGGVGGGGNQGVSNLGNFGRSGGGGGGGGDNSYTTNQSNYGQNYNSNARNFPTGYDTQKTNQGGGGGGGGYGGNYGNDNNGGFNTGANQSLLRSSQHNDNRNNTAYSKKVLISNLPPSATYKIMHEKLNEFGDVKFLEEKGQGSMLVIYGNEWDAEQAYKSLDRARIDGRVIDARIYF